MTAARVRRRWPWCVLALVLVALALLALGWWFPARWAWQWMRADYPAVQAGAVRGTVWDGSMRDLVVAGQPLGALHWTLGRGAVLGHVHGSIDLRGTGVHARGRFERLAPHVLALHDVQFRVSMQCLRALWPTGMRLLGDLQGMIGGATLAAGWPSRLDARLDWHDAAVVTQGRQLALGEWTSHWRAAGGTVVTAQLRDAGGGPVRLRGTFTATPIGWRLAADLQPRTPDAALRDLLQRLGTPTPDGGVRIERRGGLMTGAMR